MKIKSLIQLVLILAFLVIWSLLTYFIGTENIVEMIGAHNTYLIMFLVGMLGGVSTLTAASFYTTLTTFALGGSNPYMLGIVGGISITIGDSLFYLIGRKGQETVSDSKIKWIQGFSKWMKKQPKIVIQAVTFIYSGLTPLPNDILTVSLGVAKYKYRLIIIPLICGNILLTTIVAVSASSFW